ncbi:MAG: phage holin family protein [Candidatus Dormibacteraeota bacterium]|uniref:Phage holin family protein n=1 Tax=Candidatus Aeolococcus gillhamiae TaxID=3127015 RepID=A0A934K1D1_9BACT|nr:phage holin family protein [Candidatus Dormibacteraeota bacterium]
MATGTDRDESIAGIAREVADDAVRLAKAEIELAKAEAIAGVKRLAVALGLLAGAGVFALFLMIFALGAVPTVLAGHVFSGWTWWLLTAALFLLVAALLALLGFRSLKRGIGTGKQLVGEVKEDVAWLKRLTKRNAKES